MAQRFQYAGEERDEDGIIFLRARYYNPSIGRFMSRDPLRKSGPGITGWNRYAYAGDNPVTLVDPSGLCSNRVCGNTIAAGQLGVLLGLDTPDLENQASIFYDLNEDISSGFQQVTDVITGFSDHAIDQIRDRNISEEDIEDAVTHPLNSVYDFGRESYTYIGSKLQSLSILLERSSPFTRRHGES